MDEAQYKEVIRRLDQVIGLLAIQGKQPNEQIQVLYSLGFESPFIGAVTGLSPDTVRWHKRQRQITASKKRPKKVSR